MFFTKKMQNGPYPKLTSKPGAKSKKQRHVKYGALWIAALMIFCLLLPACDSDGSAQSGSSAAAEPVFDEADTLTVNIASREGQTTGVDYMTKLAQDAGFRLTFKAYTAQTDQLFLNDVKNATNTVFVCSQSFATKVLDEGLLVDNYAAVSKASSGYIKQTELLNPESTAYLLPVNFGQNIIACPAVLVRTDLYNEYGKEIRSAQDYEDLLNWLKQKDPDTVPGLADVQSADQSVGAKTGYMALDLFLPEMGYTSLAGLCLQETGATNFLWTDKDGVAHAFYDLVDAQTAIGKFLTWKREGLIELGGDDADMTAYPTILVNSSYGNLFSSDLVSYTYNVFSEPDVQAPDVGTVAIAGQNTDVTEFIRFIDWTRDIENYKYMEYGVEGVDYSWNGQHITSNSVSDYYKCYQRSIYYRLDFTFQLFDYSQKSPAGYVAESTVSESADPPLDWQTRYELGKELNSDAEYQRFVSYVHKTMVSMFNTLYATDDSTLQNQKIQEIFEAIQRVNAANTATELVNAALGN